MKFMVLVKATAASEAEGMPSKELLEAMGAFNAELATAGMLLAGEGLRSSRWGARIGFGQGAPKVTDGPFTPEGLIAGFWLIEAKSKADVVAWFSRCPNPYDGAAGEIEIRQVFGAEDFPAEIASEELKAKERALREVGESRPR